MLAALLNVTGWMVLMGLALLWLPATETALIAYTMPVWAAMLAWPVLGERPTVLRAIALVMAFAGARCDHGRQRHHGERREIAGHPDGAGRFDRVCARHRAVEEIPAAATADTGRGLQIGLGCFPVAIVGLALETTRLDMVTPVGWGLLFYSTVDPVLRRLRVVVCGAGAAAGVCRRDRHHGGAGDRRGGLGDRAARAARDRPDRPP